MSKKKSIEIDPTTRELQKQASDPSLSVWVSANAGSGKTHVLSQRVIRLLLDGVEPSKILCLTYTKTAAAEMVNRVFERLAEWTALNDADLAEAMRDIGESNTKPARLKLARTLFARALETPGGLQIQTIHAFCTTVLKRFPLEANIAGHFEMMDDETGDLIKADAINRLKVEAHDAVDEALASAYELALDEAGEHALEALFEAALSGPQRSTNQAFVEAVDKGVIGPDSLAEAVGLKPGETRADVLAGLWPLSSYPETDMKADADDAAVAKGTMLKDFAADIHGVLRCKDGDDRFEKLKPIFIKANGERRSTHGLKSLGEAFCKRFDAAAFEVEANIDRLTRLSMLDLSKAAHILLRRLIQIYRATKTARGLLDYDDLIEATDRLLQRDYAAAWVQYKLDQGIDHVLVDEAQDTNPRQWSIINTLTGDFFAGQGARSNRTIFVVGDEKQSIYSFQGARPDVFGETGREKERLAKRADVGFKRLSMPLSFRSTPEVLEAVDAVFGEGEAREGLIGDSSVVAHTARRKDEHGRVEVWDMIVGEKADKQESDWTEAIDHVTAPALQLATDIASTIADLVRNGRNPATGNKVEPGDILVLVRKRDKFMHALSRELKDLQIPVAGADRLTLTGHIAIQDLMAIARITLQPADDLSLAALLRSPVFGISDEELTGLASGRDKGEYLVERISERAAAGDARFAEISNQLKRWRDEADFAPVHEFYARVLGRDGARAKLIARLGGEAADVIDEFMAFALSAEKAGVHGLQSFVETLARAEPEIKRELGGKRGEVRIMTVHGAKGLEAKHVFLVDPGSQPFNRGHLPPLVSLPVKAGNKTLDAFCWVPKSEFRNSATKEFDEAQQALQEAEYRRLLYVGMTRAEDVLTICGFRNANAAKNTKAATWIDMALNGIGKLNGAAREEHPVTKRTMTVYQPHRSKKPSEGGSASRKPTGKGLPDWLTRAVPEMPKLPKPLTPSGFGAAVDDPFEPVTASPVFAKGEQAGPALRRGSAVHRLLEVLPGVPAAERQAKAELYLERRLGGTHAKLAADVVTLLADEKFAPLFAGTSRAEVSIGGQVAIKGEKRAVSGKIDRLAITESGILIADYKTTRPYPKDRTSVPESHVAQLALYAELLKGIYPDARIGAALVYTEGPTLHAYDESALAAALSSVTAS